MYIFLDDFAIFIDDDTARANPLGVEQYLIPLIYHFKAINHYTGIHF